jgi:hypothetical protein
VREVRDVVATIEGPMPSVVLPPTDVEKGMLAAPPSDPLNLEMQRRGR